MALNITDLYRFVNGSWLDTHEIPNDRPSDGTFYALRDQAEADTHALLLENPDTRAGALYASYMDTDGVERAGISAIDADLALVDISTIDEFLHALGALSRVGISLPFGAYIEKDSALENASAYLYQAGLGLPDEAYYHKSEHAEIRSLYQAHIVRMLGFIPQISDPEEAARTILELETTLAQGHWDVVSTRDAVKTFNPVNSEDLPAYLRTILTAAGFPEGRYIVMMPDYFDHLGTLLDESHLEAWKLWATWHIIKDRAGLLTAEISKANFDFYGTTLSGSLEQRDRWKRALGVAESFVGQDIGKLFVAKHFPASYKEEMLELVDYLIRAYRQRISSLPWMTPETREKALEKLGKFQAKIGYPDTWRDYSGLEFSSAGADLVANYRLGSAFAHDYEINKIGKPANREEWFANPQVVNAFYNPVVNDITFPAAILRPPFFDKDADAAEKFGAIGAVIGHEIGHGFDDQGSQYDGNGNLNSWWSAEDRAAFAQLTGNLVEQFNGKVPHTLIDAGIDTAGVNGEFTLGENIGDLGGLGIAVVAYRLYLDDHGMSIDDTPSKPFAVEGGSPELYEHSYNGLQRLFLSWAHVWRTKQRPEYQAQLLAVDPHSPAEFRCNIIAGNIAEFYEAFDIPTDAPVYIAPEDRVTIW
ncbi:peptidase M13 [Corynebacterium sp. ES2794-CONJ1]|uniref:M13 family metallopeptidase n=1 Tax=unclassified Corynebacterium TaxID=2624378 RepID=UPI002166E789|nr:MULTISPECIES: M13-type metalloendopeptidase [unclassified Corynebacterium]MCS4490389.1 peptidase M13 [Corynebacterium sp. ES2775-CONJ]MCS4492169.1 peptidase M13 [Corynebacterium sp. ES2715-CONJ3]MCU9519688.1 peptidase M13 [Corynebacterium sp. ES2794-CONJ1]